MKQITLIISLFLMSFTVFAQDLVITGIFDGNLTGGTPKAIEIYVLNDIADLSTYGFSNSSNGNGISEVEFVFSGSATAGDYFYISTNEDDFMTFFGFTPDFTSNSANNNGNDSIALYDSVADDGSGTLQGTKIDVYGDLDTDGTGEAWEYQDGWAYRVSGTGPDGTTFVVGNFTYSGTNANDDDTTQADATNSWPLGTYSTTPPACSLVLGTATATCDAETTGTDGTTVMIPYTGGGDATYTVTITSGGGTVGGDDPTTTANGTITLTDVSENTTVTLEVASTDCMLSIDITTPACESATEVANIGALRAGTIGEEYTLTGEAVLTFQKDFRSQKYIEDSTAAILIDDNAEVITTTYTIGDGITGITGTLSSFEGTLQFIPTEDPGAATSTGNTITAQVVTADMLNANPTDYESEYVQLTSITIDNTNSTTWDNGLEYPLTTANGGYIFRAAFFDVDYIDTTVPATADISGIITRDNDISYITARNAADINVLSTGCPLSLETATFECTNETTGTDGTTISIPFSGGANGVTYTLGTSAGTIDGDNPSSVETGTIVITGVDESTTVTFTVVSDTCDLSQDLTTPACEPLPEAATIAELRSYDLGTEVIFTGEAVLTFQQSSRNQKYIEDATAAIFIDDSAETITTTYNLGDGITRITGTLGEFRGVLQFVPSEDPGAATSTGNAIVAQVVTLAELTANGEDYESEYVEVMEATIDNGGDTNWTASTNYTISNGGDTFTLRTNFRDADYIDTSIPTIETNISGIVGQFNDTYQLQPRFLADFEEFMSVGENNALVISIFPNPATNFINITTSIPGEKSVAIYEISGKKVIDTVTAQPISVANLSAGIYLVRVTEANRSMTTKLIIK